MSPLNLYEEWEYQDRTAIATKWYSNRDPIFQESTEEKVIALLKGGFEEKCGMSFDTFIKSYNALLQNHPEKLI